MAASSLSARKWATPLSWLCTAPPPSSAWETSSPITAFTTLGPVMYMVACSLMITKSMMAGE